MNELDKSDILEMLDGFKKALTKIACVVSDTPFQNELYVHVIRPLTFFIESYKKSNIQLEIKTGDGNGKGKG